MADSSQQKPGSTTAVVLVVPAESKELKPTDRSRDENIIKTFGKWLVSVNSGGDTAKSRMLDSPEMEARYAVDKLSKSSDGTTVIHYHFSNDSAEATSICAGDPLLQTACTSFEDGTAQRLAREAMRDIVTESHSKIAFQEVHSADAADVTFVTALGGAVDADGSRTAGFAGRGNNRNFVVSEMGTAQYTTMFEQAFNQLPPEQKESVSKGIRDAYGSKYDKDVSIFEILSFERQRKSYAHEIEHILGAKHPQEKGEIQVTLSSDPETFNQSIMGTEESVMAGFNRDSLCKTLGRLDVEWYQRHFGVKDVPDSTLATPLPLGTDQATLKKQRY